MKWFIIVCAAFFLVHQYLSKIRQVHIEYVDSYLDPLLCMPLLLYGFDVERRYLWQARSLTNLQLVGVSIVLAIIFETIFPYLSAGFTGDWRDFIAYFTGTGLYLVFRSTINTTSGIEGNSK